MLKSLTPASIKFKSLKGCLTSNEISIPGYIYEETVKITFKSVVDCYEILDFILNLLNEVSAPIQKLKVLKMLKHVAERGNPAFGEMLSKKDRHIKETTGFSSLPDQVYGNSICIAVRNEAQELLNFIHSANKTTRPLISGNEICGMGSNRLKSGKFDGFGSAQTVSTSMLDRVVSGISDLMDDMRKGGALNASEVESQLRRELQLENGGYQPVKLPEALATTTFDCHNERETVSTKRSVKQRVAGRPGGGWDDDELDIENKLGNLLVTPCLSQDTDCIDKADGRSGDVGHISTRDLDDDEAEQKFVEDIIKKQGSFTSWKELDELTNRLKVLNPEKVMGLLCKETKAEDDINYRILQLIEAVIPLDIIALATLNSIVGEFVKDVSCSSLPIIVHKANKINITIQKLIIIKCQQMDIR